MLLYQLEGLFTLHERPLKKLILFDMCCLLCVICFVHNIVEKDRCKDAGMYFVTCFLKINALCSISFL